MTACIVGWSHLAFGRRDHDDVESMICSVASEAINDSGFGPADIDAIYLGHFGGAFSPQGFTSSLVFQSSDALRFKPCLLYTSPSPRDQRGSRMPSSA